MLSANGQDIEAREAMVNAIFLGGMSLTMLVWDMFILWLTNSVRYITHMVSACHASSVVERENVKRDQKLFSNVARPWDSMLKGKQTKNVLTMLLLK